MIGPPIGHGKDGGRNADARARLRERQTFLAMAGVLLLAAVLRGWGLAGRSLWFDEAYSLFIARQPLTDIFGLLRDFDTHPPLSYILLHGWMALAGRSEAAVRLPSVLAGSGVVLLTFLLGQRLAGVRVGVLAALLVAASPSQVIVAREARMYSLLTLFAAGASYALWLALEEGRRRHWIAYIVLLLLALSTHHLALLLVLPHGVLVLVTRHPDAGRAWARAMLVVAVGYLPLVPMLVAQANTARHLAGGGPSLDVAGWADPRRLVASIDAMLGTGMVLHRAATPEEFGVIIVLVFALVLLAAAGGVGLRERRRQAFLLTSWLLSALIAAWTPLQWSRTYTHYFSFAFPPLAILLATGIFSLASIPSQRVSVALVVGLGGMLIAVNGIGLAGSARARPNDDWRAIAGTVAREAAADDFILLVPDYAFLLFGYYFQGRQAYRPLSPREMLAAHREAGEGRLRLRTSVPPERMERIARAHPRMWMVAAVAMGPGVRQRVDSALAPYFRPAGSRTIGAVSVSLWESLLYRHAAEGR